MNSSLLLHSGRVVRPGRVVENGWVLVEGETIADAGSGTPPTVSGPALDLRGQWLLPGFVDLHVHGGGGHDVTSSAGAMAAAVEFHRTHGTTRTLVSLVTAPLVDLEQQLGRVAELVSDSGGHVVGSHLEGPYLSHVRCGAQNPRHLRSPDRKEFSRLVAAARGTLRSITVAPELPGALDIIGDAVAAGAIAAIGHTDATYAEALRAIEAGATVATHLFNGMRPIHHREPGPAGAALASDLACEVINDGIHVHPAITALVNQQPGRLILVTDAIDAAGMGDGEVELGGQRVEVRNGEARLASTGSLAGSTLTMDAAVRRAVLHSGLAIVDASVAASGTPARLLGRGTQFGAIEPGLAADLVVLDAELMVAGVLASGGWVGAADEPSTNGRDVTQLVQTNVVTGLDH
ncbi:MAG: N-acetylglucosamine-6-phosphate deacetylase [Pseudonocardiales bacterium]|jgi:N-acetylglucosamine-6-phosphate deacetylase|nr:N-acetylglucosamine-6-phosphate deacetylase [Pseudonocardiales bacterium]